MKTCVKAFFQSPRIEILLKSHRCRCSNSFLQKNIGKLKRASCFRFSEVLIYKLIEFVRNFKRFDVDFLRSDFKDFDVISFTQDEIHSGMIKVLESFLDFLLKRFKIRVYFKNH